MCDLSYALIREDFIRRVENERLAAVMILAAGGEVRVPDVDDELERFDAALNAAPAVSRADVARAHLREALGLPAMSEGVRT